MAGRCPPVPAMGYDAYMQQQQQPAMVHVGQGQFGFQPQAQPPEQYQPAQQHLQPWPNPHQQQQLEMGDVSQEYFGFQPQGQPAHQHQQAQPQQPQQPLQHQQPWPNPLQQQQHVLDQYYPTYTNMPQPYAGRQQQEQFPMLKPEIRGTKWRNTKLKGIRKMSKDQFNIKNRAFKMFQTGQGADCVIEVVQQIDDQDTEIKKNSSV